MLAPADPVQGGRSHAPEAAGFQLGVATFSLREFRRPLAIKMIRELGVRCVSVKEYHLPYSGTAEELAQGRADFERAGLEMVSGGNIGMPNDDAGELRRYFEYARACGMPTIVCAPTERNVGRLESLVKEYGIRIAIHNHGPEDKNFPTPQSALEAVKNMDPRCGLCIDVGHTARTGVDVVEAIAAAGPRLLDMHMKDLRSFADRDSQCAVGEGRMPVAAIFRQLKKMGYRGAVNLEYEISSDSPLAGMQSSLAYMRGVLAGMGLAS